MRITVEREILDRQMAELYEAIKDSPASNSKLDILELIIAHPGDLYHQVIREQFTPVAALINQMSHVDTSPTKKRAQSRFHKKYFHLLVLLLQKAMPAKDVLALLQVNSDYVRSILSTLSGTAAASALQTLLGELRICGIPDTAIANLMLLPEQAKAVPEFEESAGVSESKISESEEKTATPTKTIFEHHFTSQISLLRQGRPIDYPIIKLLTLLPDDDFREKVIRLCLSKEFLKNSSARMEKFLSLMQHLESLGVTPDTIIAAFNSPGTSFDMLTYTLHKKRVPQLTEFFNYLAAMVTRHPRTTKQIEAWLQRTKIPKEIMPTLDEMMENSLENLDQCTAALTAYFELFHKLFSHPEDLKKVFYTALLRRPQTLSQYTLTRNFLTDHAMVIETLRGNTNFSNRARGDYHYRPENLSQIPLLIFSDICSTTELSFTVLFEAIQKIHSEIKAYSNEDIKILSLSLMAIFRKEPTRDNAEKIYSLLHSKAKTQFSYLRFTMDYNLRRSEGLSSLEHIERFFDLLDLLSDGGVSDLKIQNLTDSFSYNNYNASYRFNLGDFLSNIKGKRDAGRILKILSRNYLSDSIISRLAHNNCITEYDNLTWHINELEDRKLYEVSLELIIGTSSLAKYYNQNFELQRKREGFTSFIKTKTSLLAQQIMQGKFTKDKLGKLAFLKKEIVAHITIGQAIEALNPSSALGQLFYLSRGLRSADLGRGNLSILVHRLRDKIPEILTYIQEPYRESSDLMFLDVFKSELAEHLGSQDNFGDFYSHAINMTTPLGKYYWIHNGYTPVTSSAPVMRELNLILATKTDLFLTKIDSGVLSREGFAEASLKEIQDAFLKAIKDLPNDQYKALLQRIVRGVGDDQLRVFFSDRQAELCALLTRLNAVSVSAVADSGASAARGGLFGRMRLFRAKTATSAAPPLASDHDTIDPEVAKLENPGSEIGDMQL